MGVVEESKCVVVVVVVVAVGVAGVVVFRPKICLYLPENPNLFLKLCR